MAESPLDKQTENKRPDGKFAEGNTLGNRFQPGESGNPKGRPKSVTLSEAYRQQLAQPIPDDPEGRTYAQVIAKLICVEAAKGNVGAAREIADRTEGKAKQTVTLNFTEREELETAIAGIMRDTGCSRDEAIDAYALFKPQAQALKKLH